MIPQWFHGARAFLVRELGRVPANVEDMRALLKKRKRVRRRTKK